MEKNLSDNKPVQRLHENIGKNLCEPHHCRIQIFPQSFYHNGILASTFVLFVLRNCQPLWVVLHHLPLIQGLNEHCRDILETSFIS